MTKPWIWFTVYVDVCCSDDRWFDFFFGSTLWTNQQHHHLIKKIAAFFATKKIKWSIEQPHHSLLLSSIPSYLPLWCIAHTHTRSHRHLQFLLEWTFSTLLRSFAVGLIWCWQIRALASNENSERMSKQMDEWMNAYGCIKLAMEQSTFIKSNWI